MLVQDVIRLTCLAAIAASAQGCILPVPTREHESWELPGRANVTPAAVESIRPGGTTRVDVLLALGQPDGAFAEERTFVYLWCVASGYVVWAVGGPGPGGGDVGHCTIGKGYALVIEFDANGLVTRREVASKDNWTGWSGPKVGKVHFPDVLRDPTTRPTEGG